MLLEHGEIWFNPESNSNSRTFVMKEEIRNAKSNCRGPFFLSGAEGFAWGAEGRDGKWDAI